MYVKIKGMGKNCWITYAINKTTKRVIEFNIGKRRAKDLAPVVNKVLMFNPKKIYTDHWKSFKKLIPSNLHKTGKALIKRIERMHLNLRTHLKCLSRKTFCYAKCIKTLEAIVRIYFWGNTLNFKVL